MNNLDQIYTLFLEHPVITIDSRTATENSLFFALRGERFDGNKFASAALKSGCRYAIVDDPGIIPRGDHRYILVDNVLNSLQNLAKMHRENLHIPVFGLTGSNGKTTTKEMMTRVLQKKFKVVATEGNFNNHIGVPLTLLRVNRETEFLVIEMGANHPGEISFLCSIAQPEAGLITNIGKAHIEGFGSFENVITAKSELYQYLRNVEGLIFLNDDNHLLNQLVTSGDKLIRYGTEMHSDFRFSPPTGRGRLNFLWHRPDGNEQVTTKVYGNYNHENAMAAIAVGSWYGVKHQDILDALSEWVPDNARSQILTTGKNEIILDAYNANPTSMDQALHEFFRYNKEKKKVIVLGDMLELGHIAEEEHRKVLEFIRQENSAQTEVFLIGPLFGKFSELFPFHFFNSTSSAADYFKSNPVLNKLILLKGSRGMALEKLVTYF